jgi:hypothetical protein
LSNIKNKTLVKYVNPKSGIIFCCEADRAELTLVYIAHAPDSIAAAAK